VTDLSRRDLLRGALAGGALIVGTQLVGCGGARKARIRHAERTGELAPDAFVTILPSGVVALACSKAEIGQGVTTAYATLVAEELEVDPGDVQVALADSLDAYKTLTMPGIPLFRIQATGGSTSTAEGWVPLRTAAAAAREMLVGAAAATWGVPASACAARAGRVVHEASGRSAGYGELTREAARRPVPAHPRLKPASEFRQIGKRKGRVDARAKVTGAQRYGIDHTVPDMVHAYAIHGPRYGARPRAVRADAARTQPGVIDVVTLRWGVAVVAARFWQARRAAPMVEIDWTEGPCAKLDTDALAAAARATRDRGAPTRDDGHAARATRGRPALDAVYEVPHLAHAPLEPQNCIAHVRGKRVEIWAPCQVPTVVQEAIAEALGVDADHVLVHTMFSGGGFGRRLVADYAVQAATIAKAVGRPVKLIWTRESDMTQGFYRPAAVVRVRGAVAGGRATGLDAHVVSQSLALDSSEMVSGGMPAWLPTFMRRMSARASLALTASNTAIDMFATEGAADTPYRIPNLRVRYTPVDTAMPVGSWRSVGHSYTGFVMESAIDELAHAAGADPLAFRRAHLEAGSRERRVLDAVARLAGWGGAAPTGHARGLARHTAFFTECAEVAEVTVVDGRIRVTRVWAAVECGVAVNPDLVRAQIEGAIIFGLSAALDEEITMKAGVVQQTNYDTFPALRMFESPRIEVTILPSEAAPTGAGEPGLPPIAPAVANALFTLTGKRLRRLPLQRALAEAAS
jgi:isoquinoline 1-oxidoreductase subunit beta